MIAILAATLAMHPQTSAGALIRPQPNVLVFSKTVGFRHDSIPTGITMMQELGNERGFRVQATEDATMFTDAGLAQLDVVVFLNTTQDVLGPAQEIAFEKFMLRGGGYVGIHAAADTEYDWLFYGNTVGAYFRSHPAIQKATVNVENHAHPATSFLPRQWVRTDEWYSYRTNPRGSVNVLMSLDESTYQGGGMGDHPITWWKEVGQGRAFYTGFGHTKETYGEPEFRRMIAEAVLWAAQAGKPASATEVIWASVDGWLNGTSDVPAFVFIQNKPGANRHLVSKNAHGDGHLHLEFKIPKGSNSGVYLMGRYEVQILDSSGKSKEQLEFSDCGGIYQRWQDNKGFEGRAPMANAFAGPDQWNTYDILFQAPKFENGKKVTNARFLEVRLNGVVIQKDVEVTGPTRAPMFADEKPEGPLMLQGDHGPVAFRNVWFKKG